VPDVNEIAAALQLLLRPGDVVAMMGAGTISGAAHELPAKLAGLLAGRQA